MRDSGGQYPEDDGQRYEDGHRRSGQRRPPSGGGRKPPKRGRRRRNPNLMAYTFIAVLAVVLIVVVLMIIKPGQDPNVPASTNTAAIPTASPAALVTQTDVSGDTPTVSPTSATYASLSQSLSNSSTLMQGLAADQMVHIEDLSIKQGLPEQWLNVLLLGTDERTLNGSARTDAMIICSINTDTGEVKLSSIMRDLAVEYTDIGEYDGLYGINAANYFGGPELAMKTVNELFEMNIQYYVTVNFFGFGKVAQQLGGVEVDVDELEMTLINKRIVEQYKFACQAGITDFDTEQVPLEEYGENIHLNGNQTLAYARIRKTDGGDYKRTTRQQIVLNKLLEKAKKLSAMQLANLLYNNLDMIKTNLEPERILSIATQVIGNGLGEMKTFRLPQPNTYAEEVRNGQAMLYDCDFATNALRLYNFIYE